jgi:tRNA threonylcarbamoyl adenosine modification protein YeaZ
MPDRLNLPGGLSGRTLVIATGHDLSLALLHDGDLVAACHLPMVKGHAEALVPEIARLLAPAGGQPEPCANVVVEIGPGSFTGLRVGLAAARALALAWGAQLSGVRSTLLVSADARSAGHRGSLLVALAAPRGQVWLEGFDPSGFTTEPPRAVSPVDAALLRSRFETVAGTAVDLLAPGDAALPPRAAAVAGLAMGDLGEAEILYVRAPDAREGLAATA